MMSSTKWEVGNHIATTPEDQDTVIGNMHKTFGKDRACGSEDILTNRQTHTYMHGRTHHNTLQPLARAK